MSVRITDRCVLCGACEWECPNEAISLRSVNPMVVEELCTECYGHFGEAQCIVVCPVRAIQVNIPESTEELGQKFLRIRPDQQLHDTWIWRRIDTQTALVCKSDERCCIKT
jgi:ferredoxin